MAVQLKAKRLKAIGIEPPGDGPAEGQASPAAPKDAKQTGFMLALMDAAEDEALELPPSESLFWKAMTLDVGGKTFVGNVWPDAADLRQRALEEAVAMVEHGELECIVDPRRFSGVEAAVEAVKYMLSGQALGKVVLSFVDMTE